MSEIRKYNKNRLQMHEDMQDSHGFYFCQSCGRSGCHLETHHIIFRSEKPNHPQIHNVKNLIIVCRDCHRNYHDDKSARNRLVEQRELNLLFGDDVLNK